MRRRHWLQRVWRDERGEGETVSWIMTQVPLYFLVTLVVLIAMVGLRQAGTASVAHLAARQAGAQSLAAGRHVATGRGAAWGLPAGAATLATDASRRAVTLHWGYDWQSGSVAGGILGKAFHIDVSLTQRREAFYAGPGDGWE